MPSPIQIINRAAIRLNVVPGTQRRPRRVASSANPATPVPWVTRRIALVNRQDAVASLLSRHAEDERRLTLDQCDALARATNTFGSSQHRKSRDEAEKRYDDARARLERLSDQELQDLLATPG